MSWEQLIAIIDYNRADRRDWQAQPPQACPNDGEPLRTGPDGKLFCISDGWRPDGTYLPD